jgi:hypothetical protein
MAILKAIEPVLYTAPQIVKILKKIPFKTGYKKYLQDDFQKFFESFGKVYKDFIKKKDTEGLSEFKKSIGGKWNKLLQRAKKTKDLTASDTKKQQLLSASNIRMDSLIRLRWNKTANLFGEDKVKMQKAFKTLLDEMVENAPTVRQRQPDGSMKEVLQLGAKPFHYKKIMPLLKEKYPDMFKKFDLDNRYHDSAYRTQIKRAVGVPDNVKNISKFEENYLKREFRNKFRKAGVGKKRGINLAIDDQFIFDIFRSRPAEFRTKKPIEDVDTFLNFLNDVEYFNPLSKNYYRRGDPDFLGYKEFRELQKNLPKGTQLSHMLHSTVPDPFKAFRNIDAPPSVQPITSGVFQSPNKLMSDAVEWAGADPAKLKLLGQYENTILQPELESKLYNAIENFHKTGKSNIAAIEKEMINNKITTEIIDPVMGTESPLSRVYGFVSDVKGPAGREDGGLVSIEEVLEYNNG